MSERNKKYLIVLLLLGACLASTLLLIYSSASAIKSLSSIAEAGSLLRNDLETFNISESQIRERTIRIDSANIRKEYLVRVPPGFSKTQLHQEIAHTFSRYRIKTPAKVTFPEKDFSIYLLLDNTVFVTIRLQTDPDLVLTKSFGSILVAFESAPSQDILRKINAFGEPIPVVLMIEDPGQANELKNKLTANYPNILFWLRDEEGENILSENSAAALPKLQHLQKGTPRAGVLSFQSLDANKNDRLLQSLSGTTLDYIDVSEAILLRADLGQTVFKQELHKFSRKARRGEYPVAIVMGEEESLDWLQEELADFKKSGLKIIPPKKIAFSND